MSQAILSSSGRAAVEELMQGAVLLAFDFDGTLAPIVSDPASAAMADTTRRLLARLARVHACALISGRARSDVAARARGVRWAEIVGNHGIESSARARTVKRAVQRWRSQLEPELSPIPGVWIEDKVHSLSLHYRRARDRAGARRAILGALATIRGARLIAGKEVFNVLPAGSADKGRAVLALRRKLRCDRVLFVGDDVTDEDAFACAGPHFLAIRVGPRRGSAAPYHLRSQRQIDELLSLLVELGSP